MAKRDYYSVLGVARDAAPEQIRSAYRKLARKYHPDVNKDDPNSTDKFKEVQEAYDVLSDKQRRQSYDRFGFDGPRGGDPGDWQSGPGAGYRRTWTGSGWPGGGEVHFDAGDLSDLFEMFSGAGGGRARPGGRTRSRVRPEQRGADLTEEVQLSFEEAAFGTTRELRLSGPEGAQTLSVKIPAGVEDGSRIRLRGKGQPGLGAASGDLYIVTRVQPHRFFRREGLDIVLELPLTVREALLGAKIDVPTLRGKVGLTIPPGTSGGARLRLKGLGIAQERTRRKGDQHVVVRVVLPERVDADSRALIEQFDRRNPLDPRKDLGW